MAIFSFLLPIAYICLMTGVLSITIWQLLENWDRQLFLLLNTKWTNSFFDFILPYFRDSVFWAPLYIFIFAFIVINYGTKGWWWCLGFLCTVAIADMVGAKIFKEGFDRLRPCQEPDLMMQVRLLLRHCSGSSSFISNHAANHFGIATFVSFTFYATFKKWIYFSYVWAFFIAYAQVYVGVHYPLDVLGGAGVGTGAGLLTAYFFNNKVGSFAIANNLKV